MTHVWADCSVPNPQELVPSFTLGGDGVHQLVVPEFPQVGRLRELLQYLESMGSFWMGVERIGWGETTWEWIAESDEDRSLTTVLSISGSEEYGTTPAAIDGELVARMLLTRAKHQYLTVPLSFYREGRNDYRQHRYAQAFRNFYFFIEGLYGRGKTRNRQVLEAFQESAQLTNACREAWETLQNSPEVHLAELSELATKINVTLESSSMLTYIVHLRGELQHYSLQSTRPKGHPLNERMFRSAAFLLITICVPLVRTLANGVPIDWSANSVPGDA